MSTCSIGFRVVLGILFLFIWPCTMRAQTPDDRAQMTKDLQAKREAYASQLKAMDVGQLAARLEADSLKGREPFNSMAYAELLSRGSQSAAQLRSLLTKADHTSLLGLLALKKLDDAIYRSLPPSFRIAVLVDSLRGSKFFNTWGMPGQHGREATDAFVAEGSREAVQALVPLMQDKRPAPVWGSEGARLAKLYQFRVCDYAWAIVMAMRHEPIALVQNPEQRDILIAKTLAGL